MGTVELSELAGKSAFAAGRELREKLHELEFAFEK
jgi:hypothetical protein